MKPSPTSRFKDLIPLRKSFALLTILLVAPHLRAQTVAEQYLYAAANQARASQGLPSLRLDPVLIEASRQHAREMAEHAAISINSAMKRTWPNAEPAPEHTSASSQRT